MGDQNTNFFHKYTQGQNSKNIKRRIISSEGIILTGLSAIKEEAVAYFQTFLQKQPEGIKEIPANFLEDLIGYRCSSEEGSSLIRPVQAEEIKSVLFAMPTNKAPDPDSFPMEFYKEAWHVIGRDFVTVIQSFFLHGLLPRSVNATLLSLVPETMDPKRMADYCPIACCNVMYKVISKILARRLKATLPTTIELNQCAFVQGRLLLENVLLATEVVKDYHKSNISSRSAIKLDILKAFDSVRWSFIEAVLRSMNYASQFVTWIMRCIYTTLFQSQ